MATLDKPAEYKVIGTSPLRHDGVDKVTGRAAYGADIRLPGMLYGAVLRSPHAHAKILSIDTREAEKLHGVHAVITAKDFPDLESKLVELGESVINRRHQSNNVLARDKVLYFGHAVAAVAATNSHVAQEALNLIRVEYEVLPPVLDVQKAMEPDSPILLDDLRTDEFGKKGDTPTNVAWHGHNENGDVEKGFNEAKFIVEREFKTKMVHQGYIEPQNGTAQYNPDGQVTIWCSTQGSFGVREQVAEILEIPVSNIRVIPMEIGGGFGGKNGVYLEPLAVLLSKKSGYRPVKLTMSRADVLAATGPTSGSYIKVKVGVDEQGKITAAVAVLMYEAGAYPGSPVGGAMEVLFAPYNITNGRVDGYDVVVNKPRTAAYRAPGGTNAAFAAETVMDELAEKLGMDPLEFRLLNGVKEGDRRIDGAAFHRIGYLETLQAAKESDHYNAPLSGPNRGRGVAGGFWFNYGGKSSASASVNNDGTVNLLEGSVDIGGSRTSLAMQLAETLGISAEDVRPVVADTNSVGYTEGTYGSRTTFATGWAVIETAKGLIEKLKERAAIFWEVEQDTVQFESGVFSSADKAMTFKELAGKLDETGGSVVASAAVQPGGNIPGFAVHIVDVEVDPDTGKVQILRYTAAQDVGKAIHRAYVESQIQGGVAQGVGWGLNEEYLYDEQGRLLNASLLDYRMPVTLDLPMIETILVEVGNPNHPFGAKGVGEVPIVPPPAALANAIYRAVGARMTELPMSPAKVVETLKR
ncbi:MAG TPA: xanthine dehydrogenase family protein molybdopterin-binding subunit [Anaerolineales bacterium]|nr:xanthine dehydrogenase family protein molybdopterin-binding subunit [Anaerolineales bacterium]HNB36484.1 xanthine dehydrogenase family protein molybdopterin-binding subunit [Anaerolineales bacterium]